MLADEGMSTRAIAPVVGAGFNTVARDIRETATVSTGTDGPSEPRTVLGNEGRTYTPASIEDAEAHAITVHSLSIGVTTIGYRVPQLHTEFRVIPGILILSDTRRSA